MFNFRSMVRSISNLMVGVGKNEVNHTRDVSEVLCENNNVLTFENGDTTQQDLIATFSKLHINLSQHII